LDNRRTEKAGSIVQKSNTKVIANYANKCATIQIVKGNHEQNFDDGPQKIKNILLKWFK